jgi:hypothetical protein
MAYNQAFIPCVIGGAGPPSVLDGSPLVVELLSDKKPRKKECSNL